MLPLRMIRKTTITLTFLFGMIIFGTVVLMKVEVWANKQYVDVDVVKTNLDWEDYLYRKAVYDIIDQQ